ncbi:MAG: acetolactate synthase [Chitinophagales bacterium]|nr:MAG: acetolactate synthase [Chitinophagales bacterium]
MKRNGAQLAVYALEQIGVKNTFGIPGVHNTELYDALNSSQQIKPILVTHEGCAAFAADAVSRTSNSIGVCAIVPAAGTALAMSGMGEAFLDGIPMLVISGGTRRDTGRYYQLHQIDQQKMTSAVTKGYFRPEKHEDVIPAIYKAYDLAVSGEPGPVFVELPVEVQMFQGEAELIPYTPSYSKPAVDWEKVKKAADLLISARCPGIYVGWGAVDAIAYTTRLAEILVAPVSTTLQGKSAFPANHPLYTCVGFGPSAKPSARKAFAKCDVLLAVGCRFAELATGSYGMDIPENLIHVDINPDVFDKNYKTKVAIHGDATDVLKALVEELTLRGFSAPRDVKALGAQIKEDNDAYFSEWITGKKDNIVSPGYFFKSLREQLSDDAIMAVDDGNHTFLAAELFPVYQPRGFISPTDFNCMGYCVPAAIGAKLRNPDKQVVGIVGDGAFLMTGLELLTASTYGIAPVIFVFHDGELGQISQFQAVPLNRKTCTVLGDFKVQGVAEATGAHFITMNNDHEIESGIAEALKVSKEGKPVLVDVKIDYSKKTMLTKGVVKVSLSRFPLGEKVRFIARAIKRHVMG